MQIGKKVILGIILCFGVQLGFSQVNMQEGFDLLEGGEFSEAKTFFEQILEIEPNNKTAKICYARALGLSGKKAESLKEFKHLQTHYPGDFEILLNLAESFMWNERYGEASQLYKELLSIDPNNFVANLGYANANASLKNNNTALEYIDKSLAVEPKNQNAIISKKYILLSISSEYRNKLSYDTSMMHLDTILSTHPDDKEALLNKAVNYLWMGKPHKANKIYQEIIEKNIEPLEGNIGLSYTNVLLHQKTQALNYAEIALLIAENPNVSEANKIRAGVNMVNALGFDRKYSQAHDMIDTLMLAFGEDHKDLILARGRMYVWDNETEKGLKYYNFLDSTYAPSFEVKMGLAEAMRGEKKFKKAVAYIDQALEIVPNQPDALKLREMVKDEYRPKLTADYMYAQDIGDNFAYVSQVKFEVGNNGRFRSFFHYTNRRLEQVTEANSAHINSLGIGTKFQANKKLSFFAQVTPFQSKDGDGSSIGQGVLLNTGLQYEINKSQSTGYSFSQELHNYNADLLRANITMSNHAFFYHIRTPYKVNLYTQFITTSQSDGNLRNLLYASLYYNLSEIPYIKFGVNYSVMTHREQFPNLYFSPDYFQSIEGFVNITNIERRKNKIIYDITVAFGEQTTRETPSEFTRRIDAKLGFRFNESSHILGYYRHSNASQTTVTGFSYTAIGVQAVYTLGKNKKK